MLRHLIIALSALAVALLLIIGSLLYQDAKKRADHRRQQAAQMQAAAKFAKTAPPIPPPLPPAIESAELSRILVLGKPQPPAGRLTDYTWDQLEEKLQKLRAERVSRPQALDDLHSWYNFLGDPYSTNSEDFHDHIAKI